MDVAVLSSKYYAILSYIGQTALIWVLGYGCYLIITDKNFDIGNLASFAFYSIYAGIGFSLIAHGYSELKKISGIYNRIYSILNDQETREDVMIHSTFRESTHSSEKGTGVAIRYENVCFAYPLRDT
jgi:ABC-type multidrug transport system fused ATPase/permease subunit